MAAARLILLVLFAASANAEILNIKQFLDTCPQSDPAINTIRADFQIRVNGVLMTQLPPCTEPVSAMPIDAYNDYLIILQALRVAYHMDNGMAGHLPWTDLRFYDWVSSRVGGINIEPNVLPRCCAWIGPPIEVPPPPLPGQPPPIPPTPSGPTNYKYLAIVVPTRDAGSRDNSRSWYGIVGTIGLLGHEARHVDDLNHSSCCGIPGGCDDSFDVRKMPPYGVQWWMNHLWLDGTINVGLQCLPASETQRDLQFLLDDENTFGFWARFCTTKPPILTMPALPGGRCYSTRRARTIGR